MSTKQERQTRLTIFVDVFNIVYPKWEIDGDATKKLQPNHVEYRSLPTYIGRCGPRRNGRAYFGLNHDWWDDHTTEERLGLLLHELAHIKQTNHRPAFWEHVVRLFTKAQNNQSEIATALNTTSINWHAVKTWLVSDPNTNTVDNRTENAYERRLQLAQSLDYPTNEIEPFDGINYYWKQDRTGYYTTIDAEDIEYEQHALTEVLDWFNSPRQRDGVEYDSDRFLITYPTVTDENGTCTIVDGDYRIDMQRYAKQTSNVKVKLVSTSD